MNDTAQPTTQNQVQPMVSDQTQGVSSQPVVQPTSVKPGSLTPSGKESAPMAIFKPGEFMKENLPPVAMPQEVKEAGVEEAKGEMVAMSQDMQQAGVQPVGLATSIPTEPTLKFPITEEKAQGILKLHKNVKESVAWLAMLIVRQMKMLRLKQKEEK